MGHTLSYVVCVKTIIKLFINYSHTHTHTKKKKKKKNSSIDPKTLMLNEPLPSTTSEARWSKQPIKRWVTSIGWWLGFRFNYASLTINLKQQITK
jgi:hypothetical protein